MQQLKHRSALLGSACAFAAALYVARPLAQDAPPAPAPRSSPAASPRAQNVPVSVCRGTGRLACDQVPTSADPSSLCAHLTACLENRRFAEGVIEGVVLCSRLSSEIKLSDGRVHALAAVSAVVEASEGRQFHAAYLVGDVDQGWCLLDELLDPIWSPNGCDASFPVAPRPASREQPSQLTVSAQRTCYDTRDQGELARGESNVRSVACVSTRYALEAGTVRRLDSRERDGACSAKAK
jgi:hypothetical protein